MSGSIDALETPCVLVDLDRVEANLQRAQAHATAQGFALRPHIKTHKIPRFAARQVELGAVGITCQKLGEAEIMADAGLTDIFLPYNLVGPGKLARLRRLSDRVSLAVTADSLVTIKGYAAALAASHRPLTVLVECDTGGGRCGVQSAQEAVALAQAIAGAADLRFGGLMTYPAPGTSAATARWLATAKAAIEGAGLEVPTISAGNSPDMWDAADGVTTERRPGTYIYNDRSLVARGVATPEQCALTVLATVVSRPTGYRAVVDAGSKSLSSDLFGLEGFGVVHGTGVRLRSLSEEHGVLDLAGTAFDPQVGDRVQILPNHACVVSNLFDCVHLVSSGRVVGSEAVAARGRVD